MCKKLVMMLLLTISLVSLSGCGEDSNQTTGSLNVEATSADLTGGRYEVSIVAKYSNAKHADLSRTPITIRTSTHTLAGVPATTSDDLESDSTGVVTKILRINQATVPIYVDIQATTGGISDSTTVTVPAL